MGFTLPRQNQTAENPNPEPDLPSAAVIEAAAKRLNLLVITPLGRSGSYLAQSLFDGHPECAMLPHVAQAWDYEAGFAQAGQSIAAWLDRHPRFYNGEAGFAASNADLQSKLEDDFRVRRPRFEAMFDRVFAALDGTELTPGRKIVAALALAWAESHDQDIAETRYVVFQHHNHRRIAADMGSMLTGFPDARLLATCRHPIESALSFKALDRRAGRYSFRNFSRNVRGWSAACWRNFERAADQTDAGKAARLLDLNSLHANPDLLVAGLAAWLGLRDHESLRRSTVCGIPWLGNSGDGRPIDTFDASRARLLYRDSVGAETGLSVTEYRFAERLTRGIRTAAGYPDDAGVERSGLAGLVWTTLTRIEFYRGDVIDHDRGLKRFVRRFGLSEQALVLKELLALRLSRRLPLAELRLDRTADTGERP